MKILTLKKIAELTGGQLFPDVDIDIVGVSGLKEAKAGQVSFLANAKYIQYLESTLASVIIVPKGTNYTSKPTIEVEDPSVAFSKVVEYFQSSLVRAVKGIHPSAVIADDAVLAEGVGVGPFVVIESGVHIKENAQIHAGCVLGCHAVLDENVLLYPNVTILPGSRIGKRVIIHSATVIGSDGFGYTLNKGRHVKIPHVGNVVIEDDVEIGSNVSVDRARFGETVIGAGTKIDNIVQIGHNVKIGRNCIFVANSGVAGSTEIKDNCVIAGQVGVAGHLTVGPDVTIGAKSAVFNDITIPGIYSGAPAVKHRTNLKAMIFLSNIDSFLKRFKRMENKIDARSFQDE